MGGGTLRESISIKNSFSRLLSLNPCPTGICHRASELKLLFCDIQFEDSWWNYMSISIKNSFSWLRSLIPRCSIPQEFVTRSQSLICYFMTFNSRTVDGIICAGAKLLESPSKLVAGGSQRLRWWRRGCPAGGCSGGRWGAGETSGQVLSFYHLRSSRVSSLVSLHCQFQCSLKT